MTVTITDIQKKKTSGEKITMLTAYDYSMARLIDQARVDMVLVGDSLGMVALGYSSTVPVTMEEMLHHCRAVSRGVRHSFLVGDMPYLSYQVSEEEAVRNAGLFIKTAGCHGVKLEGGSESVPAIEKITRAGIPVMGHIGLTPQTATALGGYSVQGKDVESGRKLVEDAQAVSDAGVFAIVLECIPSPLAALITETVPVPTVGIGAGNHCDGQVLVTNDLLGLYDKFTPGFVKKYADLAPVIRKALSEYVREVEDGGFPDDEHSFRGSDAVMAEIISGMKNG